MLPYPLGTRIFFAEAYSVSTAAGLVLISLDLPQVSYTSSPPKILPAKPKVYLLGKISLPAGTAVDLCA